MEAWRHVSHVPVRLTDFVSYRSCLRQLLINILDNSRLQPAKYVVTLVIVGASENSMVLASNCTSFFLSIVSKPLPVELLDVDFCQETCDIKRIISVKEDRVPNSTYIQFHPLFQYGAGRHGF